MSIAFRRDRIGVVGTVGGADILPQDWVNTRTRLAAVERLAATINPSMPGSGGVYLSTQSHGLGGSPSSEILPPEQIRWTPIFIPAPFTSFAMSVYVSVPQPGGLLRLALYDVNRQAAKSFLTVNANTAGWKFAEVSSGYGVAAGMNWLAVHANDVPGIEIHQLSGGNALFHSGTTMVTYAGYRMTWPWGNLPDALTSEGPTNFAPFLGLRMG